MNKEIRVAVTGAAGQIGYALLFRIASGEMFGLSKKVHLQLLELEPSLGRLQGVKMELEDCAFPLLSSITITSDLNVAFRDVDWALLVGSVPRKAGMERGDLLKINGGIFTEQGKAINQNASKDCKVLVVGNPCNTNALIAKSHAPNIAPENFFAMTMLDQNRSLAQIALKAKVGISAVKNVAIWGNHSATQYPNFYQGTVNGNPIDQVCDESWLKGDFITTVQKRGAAIIEARGLSSAASAANAVIDTVKCLTTPTPTSECFSVAVCSDGSYGIPEGLIFGYPVRSDGENWKIVGGIDLNDFSKEKIKVTTDELINEKETISDLLI